MINQKCTAHAGLVTVLAVLLTSCGGDDSSSSTPATPVAVNRAPSVSLSDVPTEIREGEALSFSFSGSDPDGDSLTYSLSTTAGPDLALSASGTSGSGTAPAVDANTSATIQVTASDGRLSATATANVTVLNNTPPVAALSVASENVDEGELIEFSAAESTDAEGDALSYSYVQIAGPLLNFGDGAETFTASAPEVDSESVVTLEVQVSDGRDVSTQRVDVTVRNLVQTPAFSEVLEIEESLAVEGDLFGIEGFLNPTSDGLLAVSDTEGGLVGLRSVRVAGDASFVEGSTELLAPQFERGSTLWKAFTGTYLITESDGITFLQQDTSQTDPVMSVSGKLEIDAPCATAITTSNSSAGRFFIVSGQDGVSLYSYDFLGPESVTNNRIDFDSFTLQSRIDDGRSYCALSPPAGIFTGSGFPETTSFFGFDRDDFAVQRFIINDDQAGTVTLTASERLANPTLTSGRHKFVRGKLGQKQGSMAVIVADESREGTHSLQYIHHQFFTTDNIEFFTGEWPLGTPADLAFTDFDIDGDDYVFAVTPDTPQAVGFRLPEASASSAALEASYLEVGLGASLAFGTASAVGDMRDNGFHGLVFGYPDKGEIKRFDQSDLP